MTIKGISGISELDAASLTAPVGGTIVHVLGWKERMAILPASKLKVRNVSFRHNSVVFRINKLFYTFA